MTNAAGRGSLVFEILNLMSKIWLFGLCPMPIEFTQAERNLSQLMIDHEEEDYCLGKGAALNNGAWPSLMNY